jgi:RNA polymerase sigma factor for flagellar operon FliA
MATMVDSMTIMELWKNYKATEDIELRNELVLKYGWLVKSIVRRVSSVSGNYTEAEDLTSYGVIGLIKAIEKFDLEKGVTFETFATYRIRGEIIDFMRRNDWVPRSVRKKILDIETASNSLTNEFGRQPTEEELSKKLGIGTGELMQTLADTERFSLVSFEEMIYDTVKIDSELADLDTPESHLHEHELLDMLAKSLDELPEREKLILTLYYYEELTLKEISGILGVSESRISQIHSRSIDKMRKSLKTYINI